MKRAIIILCMLLLTVAVVMGLDRGELGQLTDEQLRNNLNIEYDHLVQDADNIYFYFGINNIRARNNLFVERREYIKTVLEKQEILLCLEELGRECYRRIINSYDTLEIGDISIVPVKAQLLTQARHIYTRQKELRNAAARDARTINDFLNEGTPEENIDVRQ